MRAPLVSCICPTFNRPPGHQHLVEEAIESFLRQDYPHKELIVLNDCPEHELYCDAEGVVVINATARFPTLGEKWNAAAALSSGELLAPWDDDDISLPWRLSYSVERLGDADYFNPGNYWLWEDEGLRTDHWMGVSQNASLFRRSAFERVGRHQPISHGIDQALHDALVSTVESICDPRSRGSNRQPKPEWFYVYRWGVSPAHISAETEGEGHERYQAIGERVFVPGCYYLSPHWRWDYAEATRRVLEGNAKSAH